MVLYMLFVYGQSQSLLIPRTLLEEALVAVENEVARKMILTGGPGSRRFDSKLCTNFEDMGWPRKGWETLVALGGICVQHSIDCIVTFRSSQRLSPSLPRVTFRGMTRSSGCTFSGPLCFGVESCFTSCSRTLGEKSRGRTLSIIIFPKE